MRSPAKRPLAFVAEYQFGDDNVLTATHHEEMRLKNEERVRNAKSILKLEGLTLGGDTSPIRNLKKIQQDEDRHDEIDQHNLILLQRLERIHQHLPKQFDVSHHSEAVQNAPRASNAGLRRRQHNKIEQENERMKRRLSSVKGTFDLKKLAVDAERHHYFADQLSKVGRRRKVQATVQHLTNLSAMRHSTKHIAHNRPEQFYVYDHGDHAVASTKRHHGPRIDGDSGADDVSDDDDVYNSHGDWRRREAPSGPLKLPPVRAAVARKYAPPAIGSPTLTHTSKSISAMALLNGFK